MFNIEGLSSLLGQVGQAAPSIYNSFSSGQVASNPYMQNYNRIQNTFAPQQSIVPFSQENGFRISLLNRNNNMSGGQQINPFIKTLLS